MPHLLGSHEADHVRVGCQVAHDAVVLHIVHRAPGNAPNGRLGPIALRALARRTNPADTKSAESAHSSIGNPSVSHVSLCEDFMTLVKLLIPTLVTENRM